MPANTGWTCTLYGATSDPATVAYTMVTASSLNAYTGASSYTFYIAKPQAQWDMQGDPLEDISGWLLHQLRKRRYFSIESWPFDYNDTVSSTGAPANGYQDLDNVDAVAELITTKKYLWAVIAAGARSWPAASGQAHPVAVRGWGETINASAGTRTLTLELALRGRS